MTPSSFLKAYLGRRVTMTRNLAATTSSRSETPSPIRIFCLPACSGNSSGSITTSMRSRCGAKLLRGRGARLPSVLELPFVTCAFMAAMPVSISSKTKACRSSSTAAAPSFSERRPKRARSEAFRICVSRSMRSTGSCRSHRSDYGTQVRFIGIRPARITTSPITTSITAFAQQTGPDSASIAADNDECLCPTRASRRQPNSCDG